MVRPTILRTVGLLAAAVSLPTALAACVMTPYDGELIASIPTTTVPQISGWTPEQGGTVTLLALNSSGTYDPVASTTADTNGVNWNGSTWYLWTMNDVDVPSSYWTPKPPYGCGGQATLRIGIGSYNAVSIDQPFGSCWSFSQTIPEFVDACASDNSPDFTVTTCGYLCC